MRINVIQAAERLNRGEVVALPTETVYGLAAGLHHPHAVASLFTLKGRPSNNPLIIHLANPDQASDLTITAPPRFEQLAERFWPGPLTLVVPLFEPERIPERVRAGLGTVALRIPSLPLTQQVLQATGPLVMPSANRSGRPSPTCYTHVETDFGSEFPILDGGPCLQGVESTILAFKEGFWEIGRQGALPREAFASVLGYIPSLSSVDKRPICPGQYYKHYAPHAKLKRDTLQTISAVVGFSDRDYLPGTTLFAVGSSFCPEEVAKNLYQVLRQLDDQGIEEAWIDMDFPEGGLWNTVRERLLKASAANG